MEETQKELFPPIGAPDKEIPDVDPVVEDNTDEIEVNTAQNEIKELKARLDKRDEEYSRLNSQLLQMVSKPAQVPRPEEVEEKLPDLLEDPEGYAATLERNLEKKMNKKSEISRLHTDQAAKYASLTNRFQVKEPQLAKENWDVVEFIVTKKVKEAQMNGQSIDALVFADQDRFIEDVARDVKAMVQGKPEDEDTSATEGLPSAGGITKRSKTVKKGKEPKTFSESLKEIRRLTPGYYNPASVAK